MDDVAIKIDHVSKIFRLPHERQNSLKSTLINFHKRGYELQKALNNVSFEIKKGEFFGIVGRNGSGKSTLLKTIAGIYNPTKGGIKVNGSLTPFIELGVGFNPELSGRENVFLNGALLGFSRKQMQAMYQDIVDFAELEKFMDQKLKNYSSGMQVRLAFSIAIRAKADILLLDEVLAVGDSAFQRKCYRYFEDLKDSNTTVILVTHSMDVMQRYCQSAILLESGEIVKAGSPEEVGDEYRRLNMSESVGGSPNLTGKNETVTIKIVKQTQDSVTFRMRHREKETEEYYFGFSIIKEGITFAELNSLQSKNAKFVDKSMTYKLDTSLFTPGVYEISATLFYAEDKRPVAHTSRRPQFIIKSTDEKRSKSILKLGDNWV